MEEKEFISEKSKKQDISVTDYMIFKMQQRIDSLEEVLKDIKNLTERNQYGQPEVIIKIIISKIKEIL